jgi:RNA polymerase sigma-70 factor, ECF subfamily
MSVVMTDDASETQGLLQRAAQGDKEALRELFSRYRARLKRMVHLRMSRRLQGRVDDSDVLQEAFLEASKKLPEYAADPQRDWDG